MLRGRRPSERSFAHLRLLLEQLPSSFVWTTSTDLRLTSVAGAALSIVGLNDPDALIDETIQTIVSDSENVRTAIVHAHESALEGESAHLTVSTDRWSFDLHMEPLRDGDSIVGVGGIALDASKRRIAERALVESEARFRALVEHLPICTYVNPVGLPLRTTYISPYVEELLGYPAERWLQEDDFWVTLLHPDDRDAALAASTHTHETGEPFKATYRLTAADGRIVTLLDETIPVNDEHGRPLFLQGFLLEVGETT